MNYVIISAPKQSIALFFILTLAMITSSVLAQQIASYTTNFDLAESPISGGGVWSKRGVPWTNVVTTDGLAYGTQVGTNGFDDSYAYLTGTFSANQSVSTVIHLESGITANYAEVEILLRWRDDTNYATGYECNLAYNGQYAEIIIWPGFFGTNSSEFNFISQGNPVAGGIKDGDIFQADIIGNVITVRLNGNVIATATDNTFLDGGAPGIGFYSEGAPASKKYSFTKFTYTDMSVLSIVTSVQDKLEKNELIPQVSIYPNPFNRSATLALNNYISLGPGDQKPELLILDVFGKEVLKKEINNPQTEIERSNFPDGLYFYTVSFKNKITSGKFLVN